MPTEKRQRPHISITLSKELLDQLDEFRDKRHPNETRSRTIERLLTLALPRARRQLPGTGMFI